MATLKDIDTGNSTAKKQDSKEWFKNISSVNFLKQNQAFQTRTIEHGQMIAFFYDPLTKEKLPYYDTFPLVLPFEPTNTHFKGINLHYIAPKLRAVLLSKLMEISSSTLPTTKKLIFSWDTIKSFGALPQAKACIKQYLFGQVKSNFIVVPQKDWERVIWLPLGRFKKKSEEYVWSQAGGN